MRNVITLIFFLIVHKFSHSQTSNYHKFPDSSASWHVVTYWTGGMKPWPIGNTGFSMNGTDTTVGSKSYKKIFGQLYPSGPSGLVAGLRDDTTNRKVYGIYFPTPAIEFLLYDFNLNLNDTMTFWFKSICRDSTQVTEVTLIDSVLIGGQYHKRIMFDFPYDWSGTPLSFIEGVGSNFGLFYCVNSFETIYKLCVFKEKGIVKYKPPCIPLEVSNQVLRTKLNIAPNPTSTNTLISFGEPLDNVSIFVYDIQMQLIKKIEHLSGLSYNLACEGLNKGVYIIKVFEEAKHVGAIKLIVN